MDIAEEIKFQMEEGILPDLEALTVFDEYVKRKIYNDQYEDYMFNISLVPGHAIELYIKKIKMETEIIKNVDSTQVYELISEFINQIAESLDSNKSIMLWIRNNTKINKDKQITIMNRKVAITLKILRRLYGLTILLVKTFDINQRKEESIELMEKFYEYNLCDVWYELNTKVYLKTELIAYINNKMVIKINNKMKTGKEDPGELAKNFPEQITKGFVGFLLSHDGMGIEELYDLKEEPIMEILNTHLTTVKNMEITQNEISMFGFWDNDDLYETIESDKRKIERVFNAIHKPDKMDDPEIVCSLKFCSTIQRSLIKAKISKNM